MRSIYLLVGITVSFSNISLAQEQQQVTARATAAVAPEAGKKASQSELVQKLEAASESEKRQIYGEAVAKGDEHRARLVEWLHDYPKFGRIEAGVIAGILGAENVDREIKERALRVAVSQARRDIDSVSLPMLLAAQEFNARRPKFGSGLFDAEKIALDGLIEAKSAEEKARLAEERDLMQKELRDAHVKAQKEKLEFEELYKESYPAVKAQVQDLAQRSLMRRNWSSYLQYSQWPNRFSSPSYPEMTRLLRQANEIYRRAIDQQNAARTEDMATFKCGHEDCELGGTHTVPASAIEYSKQVRGSNSFMQGSPFGYGGGFYDSSLFGFGKYHTDGMAF